MALQGGCTSTGLAEARAAARRLPSAVTAALRGVAHATARRVQARAKENLRRQTKGTGATAAAIVLEEVPERQAFEVRAGEPVDRHPALPLFLELGTKHMAARPFMGPALAAEDDAYRRELQRVSAQTAEKVLGG